MCGCVDNISENHYDCSCAISGADEILVDIYIPTEDLNILKSQIERLYANNTQWFDYKRYGILGNTTKDRAYRVDLLLMIILLKYWNQHSDGTTTGLHNYITRQEFSNVINKIRNILGSTIVE